MMNEELKETLIDKDLQATHRSDLHLDRYNQDGQNVRSGVKLKPRKESTMALNYILPLSDSKATLDTVGGKGASLAKLINADLPVPDGFHVTTEAYRNFITFNNLEASIQAALSSVDISKPATIETASETIIKTLVQVEFPTEIASEIVQAYAELPGKDPAVAVRSSATAEDLPEASFAGQQETYLNISGGGALLEATKKCWASLWTARAISYRIRQGILTEGVALAVVVQLLIPAEVSGILFTANSITGQRHQAVINAAWGLGEAVVGGKVTPDTIIIDKEVNRVLDYDIADKQVMTVRVDGSTKEQPVPESLRRIPALNEEDAIELCRLGEEIEAIYQTPMDIEWTLSDGNFAIVQARPITAMPEERVAPPTEWPMPDPKGQYVRQSIVDLMPDPLSPLFATLGLKAINDGINMMSREILNMPEGVTLNVMLTINGYAYQSASYSPRQWWSLVTRMVPSFPRMLREGVPFWQEVAYPHYVEVTDRWRERDFSQLSAGELWSGAHEVLGAFAYHLGALMASTMGPSAGSETLFTNIYEKLVREEGDPSASTFLMGFENIPLKSEKALFDLAVWCQRQPTLAAHLLEIPSKQLVEELTQESAPNNVEQIIWDEWQQRFREYLDQYGYSIYDMDFGKPLPMEEPEPILEMLKLFIRGQGKSPYERQQNHTTKREQAEEMARARLKGIKRWGYEKALNWAQSQAPLREDGIAEIGLGYPVLRQLLRELGRRITAAGGIQQANDIYWLEQTEIESMVTALEKDQTLSNLADIVQERKDLWQARKLVIPPPQLPPGKKFLGFDLEGVLTGAEGRVEGNIIKGIPASPGQVTATARVLDGPEDFDQMQPGDILVASITTPAWTPLFVMASGVVTDIGGPLSHGSIVAREYGIPAILGTGCATKLIHSGQKIAVDGAAGTVTLLENE
jgi:pyruvate,water dikinase